jgi:DNA-binding MarR family transcriptional regulator
MSKREDRAREQLGEEIAAMLGSLVRRSRRAFAEGGEEIGLPLGDARALWMVARGGSVTVGDLARALAIDPANASTLISRLERDGLLARETAPQDRRKKVVSLTAQGKEAKERLTERVAEREPAFVNLTTADMRTLRDLLRRIEGER